MNIEINNKKLTLKKSNFKLQKQFYEVLMEMESLQGIEENAQNTLKVMDALEKAQKLLPEIFNLTKKEVEEYDMADIILATNAYGILLQEQTAKKQNKIKEYVENFGKN